MSQGIESTNLVQRAKRVYEESLRARLETEAFGSLIAVEPDSGDYVLAERYQELIHAARARFGSKPAYYFKVGGGGAVRIAASRAGIH